MANGEVCCILGVCCPPESATQREALVQMIRKTHPKADAASAADRVLEKHDYFRSIKGDIEGV